MKIKYLTEETINGIIKEYQSGKTLKQVGAITGLSYSLVNNILIKKNIPKRKRGNEVNEALLQSRRHLRQEGFTFQEIANQETIRFGLSKPRTKQAVEQGLAYHGLK